jgi:hypothetical protein
MAIRIYWKGAKIGTEIESNMDRVLFLKWRDENYE